MKNADLASSVEDCGLEDDEGAFLLPPSSFAATTYAAYLDACFLNCPTTFFRTSS
jgi:hypothetical protein